MRRVARTFGEWLRHPSTILAIVVVVFGLMVVALAAQTPNWVYVTGERVTGTIDGGIVYYTVDGQQYTQDDPQVPPPPDGTRVGVYLYPDNPSAALVDRPTRWIEAGAILVPFIGAGVILVAAALRRRARRPRRDGAGAARVG